MKAKYPEIKSLGSYELDERAAIKEFEAGMTRKEAERQAVDETNHNILWSEVNMHSANAPKRERNA